jgi:hypothetical protein
MYLAVDNANSHVKSVGLMHSSNLKGMPEGSDPLTALSAVAVGELHKAPCAQRSTAIGGAGGR